MLTVFSVILPIFLVILVGYVSAKLKLLSQQALSEMGRYVIYIALPAVIIKTVLSIDIQAMLNVRYLAAYLCSSLVVTALGWLFYIRVMKLNKLDSAVSITGMVVPNSSFIGYPVILQLIDNPPVNAFAMALLVENLCIVPLCFILMDYGALESQQALNGKLKSLLKRIIKNPLLISIVIGVVGNLLHIQVPAAIDSTLGILAPSAVAVALFVIGGSLAGIELRHTNRTQLTAVTVGKLFIHPLMTAFMLWLWLPATYDLKLALVIITSMPMFSVYSVIGDIYGKQSFCTTAQLATNALSILTIPIMVAFAQNVL
ncbi:AEC family transporter [Vibrio nitrifigilis]|uniref:AEC family transporter n=1 Tax=Vibrio nitrifigilis TaxID=2789781 RepID=A0ABS0GIX8_9VIBR|nr:AEC family transporter [Vibrio nitrifigilis]MBF9002388.1 AEC family transporter [Vibrio nitrifigilis]